ncbi:YIEGIA family protein [Proteiniborus sp.]|uniref:YIEGIA family protein n=1 Tax=Proteiniborus sp. TaxID=2079015 RepID=UPI00332292C9
MFEYGYIIVPSIIIGFLSRTSMLRVDYRQYPSYPQGVFSHLTLGMIAASLGSVAVPAIVANEFAAFTFLSLAAQQFRDVRNLERQSLDNIEPTELVQRGTAYIEDIAKAFEARNYVTMLVSLISSIGIYVLIKLGISKKYSIIVGAIIGIVAFYIFNKAISRQIIEDIAEVKPAKISFNGAFLLINDIVIMNIGLEASREIYLKNGIAVEITPNDENGITTLANIGQRQAIIHNASVLLGLRKDVDEPDFTPIARRDPHTGNVVMAIVALEPDVECLVEAVKKTLVLESAKRKPLQSYIGRKAAD